MKLSLFVALAGVLALAGCSSTKTTVDSGSIHASTFSFVKPPARPAFEKDDWQPIHAMIQDAITKNLARRGISQVAAGGQVTVGYLIIVGNTGSTMRVSDYFGSGEDAAGLHDRAQDAYAGSKNPNSFEGGTLVIDIIDSTSFKLLKRNFVTKPILRNPRADARAARIQEVVDELLSDLRVEH